MAVILITDDELDIVNALRIYLKPEGYTILSADNGKEAVSIVQKEQVDLVLMDIMMPEMDGITATDAIRSFSNVPIILLTAKSEDTDKIMGLNIGADDYITKPFNPAEVVARVKSQLRRYQMLGGTKQTSEEFVNGGIVLNTSSKEVRVDGNLVSFTPIEFKILAFFMGNCGKVYSSQEIYRACWEEDPYGSEGAVAVHIRHIREKIEIDPASPRYIRVVWGQGYKMEVQNGKS